uniref:GG16494 n=1 Tax=Drosophila erecta TaxID=7220 RepID=B3P2H0_DROER
MSLFAVTWAANMEFLSNAEKHFATEFREEMDRPGSSSSDEMNLAQANAILQNATAYEEYVKDNVVKKNTLQMYKKIFEGIQIIQKEIMDAAGKVKNSISKETAESEKEFLKSFENMEPNNEDIANLLNDLEIKLKHRYQCQNSLIL